MSAFMVDKVHVDLLVKVALVGPSGRPVNPGNAWNGPRWSAEPGPYVWGEISHAVSNDHYCREDRISPDELGLLLVAENMASIHYRYPDTVGNHESVPGPLDGYWVDYHYEDPRYRLTAVEALSALSCYEYQSCEHPGWPESEAYRFCQALQASLVHALDGMSEAPWGWTAAEVAKRTAGVR